MSTATNLVAAPVDLFTGPQAATPEQWEPEMVHAMTLAELKQGDWPANRVIGARVRTFPFPLQAWLSAGGQLSDADFQRVLERTTFTSLDGIRLEPRSRLPTGLGTAAKWYFVKASWGRVYAFHDKLWRSTAKADATRWAQHLAGNGSEPQFAPSRVDDSGFVMGNSAPAGDGSGLPPPSNDWFYFDRI